MPRELRPNAEVTALFPNQTVGEPVDLGQAARVTELYPAAVTQKSIVESLTGDRLERDPSFLEAFETQRSSFLSLMARTGLEFRTARIAQDLFNDLDAFLYNGEPDSRSFLTVQRSDGGRGPFRNFAIIRLAEVVAGTEELLNAIHDTRPALVTPGATQDLLKVSFAGVCGELFYAALNNACYFADRYGVYQKGFNLQSGYFSNVEYTLISKWAEKNHYQEYIYTENERFKQAFKVLAMHEELAVCGELAAEIDIEEVFEALSRPYKEWLPERATFRTVDPYMLGRAYPHNPEDIKNLVSNFEPNQNPPVSSEALAELVAKAFRRKRRR